MRRSQRQHQFALPIIGAPPINKGQSTIATQKQRKDKLWVLL